MGKLHSLSIDQEEGNFLKGVKEDILRAAKVVGGACTGDEIDKMNCVTSLWTMWAWLQGKMVVRPGTATGCGSWDYR